MKKLIIIIILVNISSFLMIIFIGKKTTPSISKYLDSEAKRIATNIVSGSTNEILSKDIDYNDLINSKNNQNMEIEFFDYNTKEVNRLLLEITSDIQKKLLNLEEGKIKDFPLAHNLKNINTISNGVICSIPIGTVSKIPILANLGPTIPVRISFIGDVISNLKTTIKSYGINNVYLQIDIVVEISEQITMPLTTEVKKIKIISPLFIRVIQGKIPNYYLNDITKESNSTILK